MPAALRALITRPEPETGQWVQALRERGIDAAALPLIHIAPAPDAAALQAAHARLGGYRALMVVSGNAARHFFEPFGPPALVQQAFLAIKTRVWAPGPGTAGMLGALGVPAERTDQPAADAAQFESESLWQQVGPGLRAGDRVLIVRGADAGSPEGGSGRDWLAAQIRAAGGEVDFIAAYTRAAPRWTAEQQALARAAADGAALWVLSSSQALAHLQAALPGQDWAQARALTTHPRIAQAAREAGFGHVSECRPTLAEVAASIESAP